MKKIISYCLLFCFCTLFFTTCKKYPEGPKVSLRTKMARITGVWDVEYYEVDGIDSTSYILNSPYYYRYYFQRGPGACISKEMHPLDLIMVNQVSQKHCCGWDISDSKDYIYIEVPAASQFYSFFPLGGIVKGGWDIQRLTNKELWLKLSDIYVKYHNHNYYMKLKKVSEKP
ncbi:MAG: hypothetical protein HY841_00240 [Bacteroidetes bacterium]|nr:hypothetical protein [Bacteroidota bacterium]